MTRPPETDAPARRVAPGRALLRAIVLAGAVVCALLVAVGLPRASDRPVSGGRDGTAVAQAQMTGFQTVLSGSHALAWTVTEIDDVSGDPRIVEPAPDAPSRPSATGFRPSGDIVLSVRGSSPPDRPPRHVRG